MQDVVIGFNSIQKHIQKAGWETLGTTVYIFYNPEFDLLYDIFVPVLESSGASVQFLSGSVLGDIIPFLGIKTLSVLLIKNVKSEIP